MGPLEGIRILEVAGIGPGPFAGMMLSDMGADVIRIDRADRVKPDAKPPKDILARVDPLVHPSRSSSDTGPIKSSRPRGATPEAPPRSPATPAGGPPPRGHVTP